MERVQALTHTQQFSISGSCQAQGAQPFCIAWSFQAICEEERPPTPPQCLTSSPSQGATRCEQRMSLRASEQRTNGGGLASCLTVIHGCGELPGTRHSVLVSQWDTLCGIQRGKASLFAGQFPFRENYSARSTKGWRAR